MVDEKTLVALIGDLTCLARKIYIYNSNKKNIKEIKNLETALDTTFEAYTKEFEPLLYEGCKKIGETPESLLSLISGLCYRMYCAFVCPEEFNIKPIDDFDELRIKAFFAGYFYNLASIKKKENKISESLAAYFLAAGLIADLFVDNLNLFLH
jgi:hypothetical protein